MVMMINWLKIRFPRFYWMMITSVVLLGIIGANVVFANPNFDYWKPYFGKHTNQITLQQGLGNIHMPVTTQNSDAQRWFDQGLAQLFGFAHEDSIRSFEKALTYDPAVAMAYWGIAYAYAPNINLPMNADRGKSANIAIAKAKQLAPKASQKEQDYIATQLVRFSNDQSIEPFGTKSRQGLDEAYFVAAKQLMNKYPDDIHAAVIAAEAGMDLAPWKLWSNNGDPTLPATLEVKQILQTVLAKDPNHVGALHYFIHAVEGSRKPQEGISVAERIKAVAWGQPHLVHAASHIYARIGDWGSGMISGEDAIVQDQLYLNRVGTEDLYNLAHGNHNIHFQVSVLSMGGRKRETLEQAKILNQRVVPYVEKLPMLEYLLSYEQLMLTRFQQWDAVLAYPKPAPRFKGTTALWHYSRGVAFSSQKKISQAQAELKSLKAVARTLTPEEMTDDYFNFNRLLDIVRLGETVLEGRIAYQSNDPVQSVALFQQAVKQQDVLNYDEPPAWYYPVRESLGIAFLKQAKFVEAEQTFRDDLRDYPNNGRAYYGLKLALAAQSKDMTQANLDFDRTWKWADVPLNSIEDLF
jgi:tetratricopeptide (TPR) repeat protein